MTDETPIFDKVNKPTFGGIDKPDPILGPITEETPTVTVEKKWWEKILTPTFRRWAYGVTAAAVVAGATWAGKPEFIPVAAPLIMAIFYVDSNGEPR